MNQSTLEPDAAAVCVESTPAGTVQGTTARPVHRPRVDWDFHEVIPFILAAAAFLEELAILPSSPIQPENRALNRSYLA